MQSSIRGEVAPGGSQSLLAQLAMVQSHARRAVAADSSCRVAVLAASNQNIPATQYSCYCPPTHRSNASEMRSHVLSQSGRGLSGRTLEIGNQFQFHQGEGTGPTTHRFTDLPTPAHPP